MPLAFVSQWPWGGNLIHDIEVNSSTNKKVLLRERHTARLVGSARYAALTSGGGLPQPGLDGGGVTHPRSGVGGTPVRSWWWGDVPQPGLDGEGGIPHPRSGGVTHPRVEGGTLARSWWWGGTQGIPHHPDLAKGTTSKVWGVPHSRMEGGYPGQVLMVGGTLVSPTPSRPG